MQWVAFWRLGMGSGLCIFFASGFAGYTRVGGSGLGGLLSVCSANDPLTTRLACYLGEVCAGSWVELDFMVFCALDAVWSMGLGARLDC